MQYLKRISKKLKPILAFTGIILRVIVLFLWGGVKVLASVVTKHG
jgi:hypothetical protein